VFRNSRCYGPVLCDTSDVSRSSECLAFLLGYEDFVSKGVKGASAFMRHAKPRLFGPILRTLISGTGWVFGRVMSSCGRERGAGVVNVGSPITPPCPAGPGLPDGIGRTDTCGSGRRLHSVKLPARIEADVPSGGSHRTFDIAVNCNLFSPERDS
jgi:hypothetical protein